MNETIIKILREALEMESHNLLCYSKNYLMDEPKTGYEKEHSEALKKVEALEEFLKTV
jgi:hypothetical protein